ncbi:hypothetical protein D3C77_230640 [compost metagenome]
MITAKQLNGTYPHRQMRMYIEDKYPDANAYTRGAHLAVLVKKFLFNFQNNPHGGIGARVGDIDVVPRNIDEAFIWGNTPEDHNFWRDIHGFEPPVDIFPDEAAPFEGLFGKKAKLKVAAPKAPLKKQIGWWV